MRINDIFYTLQGEGANSGRSATFIRLPFCNLACPWCDTEFESFKEVSLSEIESFVGPRDSRLVVVTGGEPTMNSEFNNLVCFLKEMGCEIAVESNGQFEVDAPIDFLTVSPKRWKSKNTTVVSNPQFWFHPKNLVGEIKLVWDAAFDSSIPDSIWSRYQSGGFQFKDPTKPFFFISPEWSDFGKVLPQAIDYIKGHPQWRMSLQTHKFMEIE